MPRKRTVPPGSVRWSPLGLLDPVIFDGGYMLPRQLHAQVEMDDGTVVDLDIDVDTDRVRTRSVTVSTERPGGVGWSTLARVPTRDIAAAACSGALKRMEVKGPGHAAVYAIRDSDRDQVREIVQGLVGYRPDLERFKAVEA